MNLIPYQSMSLYNQSSYIWMSSDYSITSSFRRWMLGFEADFIKCPFGTHVNTNADSLSISSFIETKHS